MNDKILGLNQASKPTKGDIKKQYLLMAKLWHPDINKSPVASERFKQIQDAYNVLQRNTAGSSSGGVSGSAGYSYYPHYYKQSNGQSGQQNYNYNNSNYYRYTNANGASDTGSQQWTHGTYNTKQAFRAAVWKRMLVFVLILPFGIFAMVSPDPSKGNNPYKQTQADLAKISPMFKQNYRFSKSSSEENATSNSNVNADTANATTTASSTTTTANTTNTAAVPAIPEPPPAPSSAQAVDAWFNAKSGLWETPAPWSSSYKEYLRHHPLRKVDRKFVKNSVR